MTRKTMSTEDDEEEDEVSSAVHDDVIKSRSKEEAEAATPWGVLTELVAY